MSSTPTPTPTQDQILLNRLRWINHIPERKVRQNLYTLGEDLFDLPASSNPNQASPELTALLGLRTQKGLLRHQFCHIGGPPSNTLLQITAIRENISAWLRQQHFGTETHSPFVPLEYYPKTTADAPKGLLHEIPSWIVRYAQKAPQDEGFSLSSAFVWTESPQGHAFWADQAERKHLHDLGRMLLTDAILLSRSETSNAS